MSVEVTAGPFCATQSADSDDGVYWKVTSLVDICSNVDSWLTRICPLSSLTLTSFTGFPVVSKCCH